MEVIRSPHNPTFKQALKLRDAKERRRTGQFLIDGQRELLQAIAAGIQIVDFFIDESHSSLSSALANELDQSDLDSQQKLELFGDDLPVTCLAEPLMQKLAYGDRVEHAIAVGIQPSPTLNDIDLSHPPTYLLVIDRIEKPGNLGAILRSAAAFGVKNVVLTDPVCEIWNPNAIRASLGGIFRLNLIRTSADEALLWLIEHKFQIVTARVDASQSLVSFPFSPSVAIVVGSEAFGLGANWSHPSIESVRIPMCGPMDSLNVSVSAAILLYQATQFPARDP
jgi:RNA methyltransferase, TrmH family